jgi:hypothetical protein
MAAARDFYAKFGFVNLPDSGKMAMAIKTIAGLFWTRAETRRTVGSGLLIAFEKITGEFVILVHGKRYLSHDCLQWIN